MTYLVEGLKTTIKTMLFFFHCKDGATEESKKLTGLDKLVYL